MAYNGGNIGGVVFSPLWAAAISAVGFPAAAAAIGFIMAVTMWLLADLVFSRTPQQMRLIQDGDGPGGSAVAVTSSAVKPLPGLLLWRDLKFLTISAGMALGLFAQIGLAVHLYSLLVPALGASRAGLAMGLVTFMAIIGRTLIGWVMPAGIDRRLMACASYGVQMAGCAVLVAAAGTSIPLLLLGVVLFGLGFGNGTWLPPLIAQVEFVGDDVPRVVALIVAISQGTYAFAPGVFGMIREFAPPAAGLASGAAPNLFVKIVIRGLDPRIHQFSQMHFCRWVAGSSPATTRPSASGSACRRDSRRSRAGSCGRASRPRHISPAAGTAGTWSPPDPHAGPA